MNGRRAKMIRNMIGYSQSVDRVENTEDSRLYGPHPRVQSTVELRSKRAVYQRIKKRRKDRRMYGYTYQPTVQV